MTKSLQLTFKDDKNKTKTVVLTNPKEGLEEQTVKQSMQKIADANLFQKNNVDQFKTVERAQYVDHTVTPIFTTEK